VYILERLTTSLHGILDTKWLSDSASSSPQLHWRVSIMSVDYLKGMMLNSSGVSGAFAGLLASGIRNLNGQLGRQGWAWM
jgi:hypothetical protein